MLENKEDEIENLDEEQEKDDLVADILDEAYKKKKVKEEDEGDKEDDKDDSDEEEEELEESSDDSDDDEDEDSEDEDEDEDMEEEKKMKKESFSELLSDDDSLTEEFKNKAGVIFDAILSERVQEEKEKLEEAFAAELIEITEGIQSDLINKIDDYLSYVTESYIEDNAEAIDASLRTEITEGFMSKLKDLFVESYIDVPEEKRDLVEELEESVSQLESELEESKHTAKELAEGVVSFTKSKIIAEASEDLTDTQSERLTKLAEGIEFDSEESFKGKIETIIESVFKKQGDESLSESEDIDGETEVVVEGAESSEKQPKQDAFMAEVSKHLAFGSKY